MIEGVSGLARVASVRGAPARRRVRRPPRRAVEGPRPAPHPRLVAPRRVRPRAFVSAASRCSTSEPRRLSACWASRRASRARPVTGRCWSAMRCRTRSRFRCLSAPGARRSTRSGAPSRARAPASDVRLGAVLQRQGASPVRRPQHLRARVSRVRPRGARRSSGRDGPLLGRAARRGAAARSHRPSPTDRRDMASPCRRRCATASARRCSCCCRACWLPDAERPPASFDKARRRLDPRPGLHHRLSRAVPAVRRVARRSCRRGIRSTAAVTRSRGCAGRPKRRAPSAASGRRSRRCRASRTPAATPARSSSRRSTAGSSPPRARRSPKPGGSTTGSSQTRSWRSRRSRPGAGANASRSATSASNNWAPSTKASWTTNLTWDGFGTRVERPGAWPAAVVTLVSRGEVRKSSGTFYTPRAITEYLVRHTLQPLVENATADGILRLRVLDPAMGSGALLVAACRYLAAAYEAAARARAGLLRRRRSARPTAPASVVSWRSTASTASTSTPWPSRWPACRCGSRRSPAAARCRFSTIASSPATAWWAPRSRTWRASLPAGPRPGARPARCRSSRATTTAAAMRAVVPIRDRLAATPDDSADAVHAKERMLADTRAPASAMTALRRVADLWCACWFWAGTERAAAGAGGVRRSCRRPSIGGGEPARAHRASPGSTRRGGLRTSAGSCTGRSSSPRCSSIATARRSTRPASTPSSATRRGRWCAATRATMRRAGRAGVRRRS